MPTLNLIKKNIFVILKVTVILLVMFNAQIATAQLPDLTISATVSNSYPSGKTSVQIPVTVNRTGGNLTDGTYVLARLFWSTNSTWESGDSQLWESNGSTPDYPISYLNSYGSKTVTATINIPSASPGTYYIIAYADPPTPSYPSGFHTESNENNNIAVYTVQLSGFQLISPAPNEEIHTDEITFKWSNIGAIRYELYVDNTSGLGSSEISPNQITELKNFTGTEYKICGNWLCQCNYFWKVYAIFADGSKIESAVATFQYLPPTAASPQWEPLYRLYHAGDKDHFYCTSEGHKKVAENSGYKDERVEGYVSIQRFNASDVVNIFRFYDGSKDCHYYTTDENDKDLKIIAGLTYEGITGFAYQNAHEGLAKLYHLKKEFSATNHDHFYTISEFEKNNAQTQYGFLDQGITAYISPNGKDTPIPIHGAQMILGDGINPNNGNFNHYTETSFQIPGIGLPLVFAHTYNSLSAHLTRSFLPFTPLGSGWSHSYNSYIVFLETQIAVHWPDGTIDIYNKSGSTYVPKLKSVYDEITMISSTSFQIKKKDQTVYSFQRPSGAPDLYPAMLISIKDRNGNSITCQYETSGQMRLISITEPSGRKLLISYNTTSGKEHLISQVTDPLNRMIRFEYDGYENLFKFTNADNKTTEYQYDPINILDHLLTSIKRPKGNIITNEFANRIISKQQVSGYGPLQITYFTDRTNITDAAGIKIDVYNSVRDDIVVPERIVDGSNHDIDPTYNDSNHPTKPTSIKDLNGNTTNLSYDSKGNITYIQQPGSVNHRFEYDAMNNLKKYTDARSKITEYVYDSKGNLTSIIDPLGHTTNFSYKGSTGLIETISNPLSHTTTLGYNNYGNLQSVRDNLGNTTNMINDLVGRMSQLTNAKSQMTEYSYTKTDLISSVQNSDGTTRYDYDANDNLSGVTDARGSATQFSYNNYDLLASLTKPLSPAMRFDYNSNGSINRRTNPAGEVVTYGYDNVGRINSISSGSFSATFSFDGTGNLTGVSDNNGSMSFSYDALNRMTSYRDFYGNTVTYGYDAASNITRITYPGSKSVTYEYYDDNRLRTIKDWNNRTTTYTYRADGSLQEIQYPNGTRCSFSYDNGDRLVGISNVKSNGTVIANYTYGLDELGNHTSANCQEPLNIQNLNPINISLNFDAANRIQNAGSTTYSFNNNGNMTSRTGVNPLTLTYDYDNHLKNVSGSATANYVYDVFGNRRQATRNNSTTRYVLDIAGSMSQVLMETNANNTPTTYYIYGMGLIYRIKADGTYQYYHYNNVGSTIAITDQNQNITHKYCYAPFGELLAKQEADFNPFRFVGQYGVMDEENGLYFMRARYYDPEVGRFISEDPIWDVNLFAYAKNNPLLEIDPQGLFNFQKFLSGSANIGLGVWKLTKAGAASIVTLAGFSNPATAFTLSPASFIYATYQAGSGGSKIGKGSAQIYQSFKLEESKFNTKEFLTDVLGEWKLNAMIRFVNTGHIIDSRKTADKLSNFLDKWMRSQGYQFYIR